MPVSLDVNPDHQEVFSEHIILASTSPDDIIQDASLSDGALVEKFLRNIRSPDHGHSSGAVHDPESGYSSGAFLLPTRQLVSGRNEPINPLTYGGLSEIIESDALAKVLQRYRPLDAAEFRVGILFPSPSGPTTNSAGVRGFGRNPRIIRGHFYPP